MRISVDIDPKILEKIDQLAKEEKRVRKAQIEFILEKYVAISLPEN